jgi:hypothetical protein
MARSLKFISDGMMTFVITTAKLYIQSGKTTQWHSRLTVCGTIALLEIDLASGARPNNTDISLTHAAV